MFWRLFVRRLGVSGGMEVGISAHPGQPRITEQQLNVCGVSRWLLLESERV